MNKTGSYLDKIISYKITELALKKKKTSLKNIKDALKKINFEKRDFAKAIKKNNISLIAEIKKASPSKRIIKKDFDHIKIAKSYGEGRADAISIITDEHFFLGNIKFIKDVKKIVKLPILRKDFIFDEYQIYESKLFGADAVLLIAELLNSDELKRFILIAKYLDIDCLVETKSFRDIEKAIDSNAKIIGINNRDLRNFSIDLNNFLNLSRFIPKDKIIVCESGIFSRLDVMNARLAGADSVLIGTALMESDDIKEKISELIL